MADKPNSWVAVSSASGTDVDGCLLTEQYESFQPHCLLLLLTIYNNIDYYSITGGLIVQNKLIFIKLKIQKEITKILQCLAIVLQIQLKI